jgi:hypothetical protein
MKATGDAETLGIRLGLNMSTFRSGGERSNPLSYAGNAGLREKITQHRVVFYFGDLDVNSPTN